MLKTRQSLLSMQGTQIYRKELSRRLLFGAIGVVAVYLLFVRPVEMNKSQMVRVLLKNLS